MKKLLSVALVMGFVFAACSAYAADIKIGYIDFAKIREDSKSGKAARKTLEGFVNDKEEQINQRLKELDKQKAEIDKQGSLLSADAKRQKIEKLQKDLKDLDRFKTDSEEELNKKQVEIAKQMSEEVSAIIAKFGKEEGYTLILERSVVLFAPEAVDITEKIIKAYDDSKG